MLMSNTDYMVAMLTFHDYWVRVIGQNILSGQNDLQHHSPSRKSGDQETEPVVVDTAVLFMF